ncbi:cholecystokinin-like [Centroberyx affinis]|uniref:cholecystokinin-like n=1 Tax=Centroberyx affinis TaxID=166261 RepID=UPI003A5BEEE8
MCVCVCVCVCVACVSNSTLSLSNSRLRFHPTDPLRLLSLLPGSVRRNSTVNSRASGLNANHRIKDRDYLGWMDFGRRSAEEYEYSS